MTATAPHQIFKTCLGSCRRETIHLRITAIKDRLLYACATPGCKAPAREVSAPEEDAPEARRARAFAEQADKAALRTEIETAAKFTRRQPEAPRRTADMPRSSAAPKINPLHAVIDRRLDERLAAFKAELAGLVAAQFAELLDVDGAAPAADKPGKRGRGLPPPKPAGFQCPRPGHKGFCGKRCIEAWKENQ